MSSHGVSHVGLVGSWHNFTWREQPHLRGCCEDRNGENRSMRSREAEGVLVEDMMFDTKWCADTQNPWDCREMSEHAEIPTSFFAVIIQAQS